MSSAEGRALPRGRVNHGAADGRSWHRISLYGLGLPCCSADGSSRDVEPSAVGERERESPKFSGPTAPRCLALGMLSNFASHRRHERVHFSGDIFNRFNYI